MDEIVGLALKKWPNVPACYGWLGLDRRGDWYLRDDVVQSTGDFKVSKGSRLVHGKLIEFINRNYLKDESKRYYFQNGPQKVFVELELTPWVLRFDHKLQVITQTEKVVQVLRAYTDEHGKVYLNTDKGIGVVRSMDMDILADELVRRKWKIEEIFEEELERKFGFVRSPLKEKSQSN